MTVPLIIGGVLIVVAGLMAFFAVRNFKIFQLVGTLPVTPVDRLRGGEMVKLQGEAVGPEADDEYLVSPMAQQRCLYYQFKVDEQRRRGKNHVWVNVIDDKNAVDTYIQDSTGVVEIEIENADLVLDPDTKAKSGTFNKATPELQALLESRYCQSTKGWVFSKKMKYAETILEEGDPLCVIGFAKQEGEGFKITKDGKIFLVTDKGEGALRKRYMGYTIGLVVGTLACLVGCGFAVAAAFGAF